MRRMTRRLPLDLARSFFVNRAEDRNEEQAATLRRYTMAEEVINDPVRLCANLTMNQPASGGARWCVPLMPDLTSCAITGTG